MGTALNSNLFDSIVNEVEKITHYEEMFSKLSPSQMSEAKDVEYDYDLLGFMYCQNHAILADKILRAFIELEYAVKRNYEESAKHAKESVIVKYDGNMMKDIIQEAKKIIGMVKRKQIYTDSVLEDTRVVDYFREKDALYKKMGIEQRCICTVSASDYENMMDTAFGSVKTLFMLFRTELESKPYLREAYFIFKYMIAICLEMSYIHSSVSFE